MSTSDSPAAKSAEEPRRSAAVNLINGLSTRVMNNCLSSATQTQLTSVQSELEDAKSELAASRKVCIFCLQHSF